MSRRFVLLDRDGTINEEVDHLAVPSEVRLIPGAAQALRDLRSAGLGLILVTNQANVGRGLLSLKELYEIHDRLFELLREEGASLDGVYVCPHAPEEGCACRKPRPGLALRAASDLGFDPSQAFVVGDHRADMGLGRAIGATTMIVRTGHGEDQLAAGAGAEADRIVANLAEAASLIREIVAAGTPR